MTKEALFKYWEEWFTEHALADFDGLVVKLNRAEFNAILSKMYDEITRSLKTLTI